MSTPILAENALADACSAMMIGKDEGYRDEKHSGLHCHLCRRVEAQLSEDLEAGTGSSSDLDSGSRNLHV